MAAETLLVGNVGARLARHRLGLRTLARPGIGLLRRTTRYREHRHQRNRHEGNHNVQTQGRADSCLASFQHMLYRHVAERRRTTHRRAGIWRG